MDKISVVIPAYNVEKTIEKCVESIEEQNYNALEIIIINDGSTDNTKIVCENLINKYKNIVLYNNENHGVSYSRSYGVDKANGKYIMFVDSDDFLVPKTLDTMLKNNNDYDYDYIIANYSRYIDKNRIEKNHEIETKMYQNKQEFLADFWVLFNKNIINSPCFRLYKTEILKNNNIKFDRGFDLGEDLIFNLEYITNIKTVCILNEYIYYYRETEGSLSNKYRTDYMDIQNALNEKIKEFFIKNKLWNDENKRKFDEYRGCLLISGIQNLFLQKEKLKCTEIREQLKSQYITKDNIEYLHKVKYSQKRLELMRMLVVKKRIRTIIIYSKLKETVKRIVRK